MYQGVPALLYSQQAMETNELMRSKPRTAVTVPLIIAITDIVDNPPLYTGSGVNSAWNTVGTEVK